MKRYIRLCKTLKDKGKLIDASKNIYKYIKDLDIDHYSSVYYYTEEHKKVFDETSSVAGITDVLTDKLVFDFDSKDNPSLAQENAIALCQKLINEGVNKRNIQIAYSGSKGFAVTLQTNSEFTPEEHKNIAKLLCSDLETFDTLVYNPSRIFRIVGTKHQNSGLYKYPLTFSELKDLTLEQIKEKASVNDVDLDEYVKYYQPFDLPDKILQLKLIKPKEQDKTLEKIELVLKTEDIKFGERPSFLSPAKYLLHLGHFKEGERSHAAMILAATYKKAGFNKEDSYRLLKSVMERQSLLNQAEKFPNDELWNNVLKVIYSENWNGGCYSEKETDLLAKINECLPSYLQDVEKKSNLVGNDFLLKEFRKFLDDIDANTIKTGLKEFDRKLKIMTSLSYGILGAPGSSKSSFAMNMLSNCSKTGGNSIYVSLDMSPTLVTYRQMQMVTGLDQDDLKIMWRTEKDKFLKIYEDISENQFKNVHYSFAYGSNTEDIRNEIVNFQEKTGKKIRLVVIDYLESIASEYADPSVSAGVNAQKLTNIAMELNVAMIILLQTQKTILPGQIIEDCRKIKNSSLIEQSLSGLVGICRPGQITKYSHLDSGIICTILKNRLGSLGRFDLGWDRNYTRVREINDQDRLNMAEIERLKEEEENERRERFGGRNAW